jgi:hypothetical protein
MRRALVVAAVVTLAATMTQAVSAGPARWAVCGRWRMVPAPILPEGAYGALTDVAVVSSTEAWAVGWVGERSSTRPVALHWTGLEWSPTHVPVRPRTGVTLTGVAIAADGAWAVGSSDSAKTAEYRPFVAHWTDGRWHRSPVGFRRQGWLGSVATVPGTSQVWAVGSTPRHAIVLRWNGAAWRSHPGPVLGDRTSLDAVVAFRSGVAWAVGTTIVDGKQRALTARWDGHAWRARAQGLGSLTSVTGDSPRSVWAAGYRPDHGYRHLRAVIYRWNGARWARAFVSAFHASLDDVVLAARGNLWAVGSRDRSREHRFGRPLVVRRDASGSPDVIGTFSAIDGTPNNLWATRNYNTQGGPAGGYDTYHRC